MAMNLTGFDANAIEPSKDYGPIPAGEYQAIIVASEEKTTKAGNGKYLELQLNVLGPTHAGRLLWDRLNLVNPNDTAVQIAKATLSSICRAVNVLTPKDSSELHGKQLTIRVECRAGKDGQIRNEVKQYKPRGESLMVQAFGGDQPAPAATPASGNPWG